MRGLLAPLVQVSEIRTIAEDALWLSPAFGRPSAAFHFTWFPDPVGVAAALPEVEAVLEPFGVRPHWAKLSTLGPDAIRAAYPRIAEFASLARRLDPTGKLMNPRLEALLDGG
jgi:xylitol oxidase